MIPKLSVGIIICTAFFILNFISQNPMAKSEANHSFQKFICNLFPPLRESKTEDLSLLYPS